MKAWVVPKYKQPLELTDVPEPSVGDHDVLVEIHATAVNLLDVKVKAGEFKLILPYKTPFVLGHDLAGTVTAIGSAVRRFAVGDEVYGRPRDGRVGTFAQRLAVHEDDLAPRPGTISMVDAGSVPLVALTAWQALVERAHVQPGQKVLIHAGSGGVGTYAIQLAKHLGATVATTTGTTNMRWVKDLGADVVIDYKTEAFDEQLSGYDVVLDSQGGDTLAHSLTVLKPGGLAIGIAGPPDPAFAAQLGKRFPLAPVMALLSLKTRRAAKRLGVRYSFLFMRADGAALGQIAALIEAGTLRPVIDRTFPFEQTPDALRYVKAGRSKGKVLITIEETP
ncbi:MAG TPA: NADP-dependent oxidoreductase [Solirubrobacteraceae bacterium]|nr:NADP-dependent oxidoreductase [Solirubrobacteraceae bacterium]